MSKQGWRYWVWRLVRLVLIAYATVALFACTMANRMIFQPPEASYSEEEEGLVSFKTASGETVRGFYFPPESKERPVFLWSHGNAEDAGHAKGLAGFFRKQGAGFLVYDYPGYGLSSGKPTERGCYEAVGAAFDFLTDENAVSGERIVVIGQSVGTGPSVWLAEREKVRALVLISPFKSTFRVVTGAKILPWDKFDNFSRIHRVEEPLFVVHGDEDEVIPFAHGQAVYEKHGGPKEFFRVVGAGHNDLWAGWGEEIARRVLEFVE